MDQPYKLLIFLTFVLIQFAFIQFFNQFLNLFKNQDKLICSDTHKSIGRPWIVSKKTERLAVHFTIQEISIRYIKNIYSIPLHDKMDQDITYDFINQND